MTCIIGLEHKGKAYVGADSMASDGWSSDAIADPKIFQRGGYLIAYTTSYRMGQILEHIVDLPEPPQDCDMAFMVKEFTETIRKSLKDYGFSKIENSKEEGGNFIVAVKGRVFHIQSGFNVIRNKSGIAVDGAGGSYALGAMLALAHLPPEKRIYRALEISGQSECNGASALYCYGVRMSTEFRSFLQLLYSLAKQYISWYEKEVRVKA